MEIHRPSDLAIRVRSAGASSGGITTDGERSHPRWGIELDLHMARSLADDKC
jgi:hypothetical protein